MTKKLIFDAHLDLSMNALEWNRDLTQDIQNIRQREQHLTDKPDRGKGLISLAEMRKGKIGVCVATQIARYVTPESSLSGWNSQAQAWAQTQGQLAWYETMEEQGEMIQIRDRETLKKHINLWENAKSTEKLPIGYILSLEGADSLVKISYLEKAYLKGLRAVGLAHYGKGVYAYGTDSDGGIGQKGKDLLKEMERLNIILDATHLSDISFREAMDNFQGAVWASHHLCRSITPHNRQFSDEQIKELIQRQAVIGMAFDAWMMIPNWVRGRSTPENTGLKLEHIVPHIDTICQIAGNSLHVGIGSDLDGAFGKEQCPQDLETIADLQKLELILKNKGYTDQDVENIFYKNFLRFLERVWI
ncbi:dipeptidase [Thermoflexibacter ruber]|uniref:Membrane dipeptidase n=1 Tax=Thermoflexibacter ruber TaxID=1003 RepID=A0A1I2D672_9BACT|nr:membrane dipeptidase [Thermoflexibacter ruber]SFE75563.1 membrane dipeptidase [Thermoflexibacter ruber]